MTLPCVHSTRLRVYIQNVLVCTGNRPACVSTCARGAGIHGDVLNVHTGACWIYTRCFQRATPHGTHHDTPRHTTPNHTPPHTTTHHHTPPHTPHKHTQPHITTHTTSHGDRDRDRRQRKKTEKEDRERRQRERREDEREEKTRQDKMKEKMKEKKTEIMMWTDAESKFAEEKAKLAKLKSARN